MIDVSERIARDYAAALAQYVANADESALAHAYDLGRAALDDGLGLFELMAAHHDALTKVPEASPSTLGRAAEFLAESVSPFEMAQRGYREANTRLDELNRELEARNAELLRAKEVTEEASKELEAFSYSVSHDLRAPLRSVDGFSRALLEDYADRLDDQGQKYLRYVRESANEMAALIDDLLALSRVARTELLSEPVSLSAIAHRVIGRLQYQAPHPHAELFIRDGLFAQGDRRLLTVLLENLLGNAWKFAGKRDRPRIELGAESEPPHTIYFVRDNGAGFDMAEADKLFQPFARLHAASEFEGTGIGLATVHRIVRRHGGRVWGEGEVDRGATFYFTLHDVAQPGKGS